LRKVETNGANPLSTTNAPELQLATVKW
jgi:hypothetical protein